VLRRRPTPSRAAGHVPLGVSPGLPLVRADASQLERAFANLLDNAARHGRGHPVLIRASVVRSPRHREIVDRGPDRARRAGADLSSRSTSPSATRGAPRSGSASRSRAASSRSTAAGVGRVAARAGASFVVELPARAAARTGGGSGGGSGGYFSRRRLTDARRSSRTASPRGRGRCDRSVLPLRTNVTEFSDRLDDSVISPAPRRRRIARPPTRTRVPSATVTATVSDARRRTRAARPTHDRGRLQRPARDGVWPVVSARQRVRLLPARKFVCQQRRMAGAAGDPLAAREARDLVSGQTRLSRSLWQDVARGVEQSRLPSSRVAPTVAAAKRTVPA